MELGLQTSILGTAMVPNFGTMSVPSMLLKHNRKRSLIKHNTQCATHAPPLLTEVSGPRNHENMKMKVCERGKKNLKAGLVKNDPAVEKTLWNYQLQTFTPSHEICKFWTQLDFDWKTWELKLPTFYWVEGSSQSANQLPTPEKIFTSLKSSKWSPLHHCDQNRAQRRGSYH